MKKVYDTKSMKPKEYRTVVAFCPICFKVCNYSFANTTEELTTAVEDMKKWDEEGKNPVLITHRASLKENEELLCACPTIIIN